MHYARRYRVPPNRTIALADWKTDDTAGIANKVKAARLLSRGIERLAAAQDRLYAQDTWAVLVILQAMDAAGKDSTIKHVMSGVNPQGCEVYGFKAPSTHELDHDYLWRSAVALPERGRIGIHNRSYYEEVIVTRVHPEILAQERLPPGARGDSFWRRRFREINRFERYLVDNGVIVLKFFLHVSKEEQRRRFLDRLEEPEKWWKFSPKDVQERARWADYMRAYEAAFRHTSTPWAPWFIVPADHKWVTRLVVADIIAQTLDGLRLEYPNVPKDKLAEYARMKKILKSVKG
jgi:PPK2 family polyphosphate:nucleotide phosphotransferase